MTLACPFSSLRLLEENTREPIPGEKTRAQHSTAGQGRAGQEFIAPSTTARLQRYLPLEGSEAAEEGTEAAAETDEADTEPWLASTPPSLGTLLSHKK